MTEQVSIIEMQMQEMKKEIEELKLNLMNTNAYLAKLQDHHLDLSLIVADMLKRRDEDE